MLGDLAAVATSICSWGATYLLHSSCFLGVAWVYVKIRPAAEHGLRETLWKGALVGGVLTASLQMFLSPPAPFGELRLAFDAFRPVVAARSSAPVEQAPVRPLERDDLQIADLASDLSGGSFATDGNREFWIETGGLPTGSPGTGGSAEVDELAEGNALVLQRDSQRGSAGGVRETLTSTLGLAVAAALAAIALGIARFVWQTLALKRRLGHCTAIENGPARRLLDELCRLIPRAPQVRLLSASDDPEPAAFGIRRWTIVLPHRAVRDLADDELRALLAHELAHLVRGDAAWLWISRVICSCLAFQPLNHLARREWQRAAEFLCDHWAVRRTGTPLALARCLTEVAGWRLSGRASAALLAATGRKSGLADRIERLVEADDFRDHAAEGRERGRCLLIAAGTVLALATCCLPRVQLAGTTTAVTERAHSEPAREKDSIQTFVDVNQVGARSAAEGAKPQAYGAGDSRTDSLRNELTVEPPAASASDVSREAAPLDIAALLKHLDSDLGDLERELAELESLLSEQTSTPVARLAKHLRAEIGRLEQRRQILQVKSKAMSKVARRD